MMWVSDSPSWQWEVGGLALSLGAAALTKVVREYQRRRSETWPTSHGRIASASVEESESQVKLKADYTYSVGSESYAGKFKKNFTDVDEANAWAEALDGMQVAIRYDPDKPSRSRIWESDLQPIVQASAGWRPPREAPALPGREELIVYLGLAVAVVGTLFATAQLAAAIMGRPHHRPMGMFNIGIVALGIFAALEGWRGGKKIMHAAPEWMKYFGYAIVFYTAFGTLLLPRLHPSPKNDPQRIRQEEAIRDANFQLLIYFGALETLYARVSAARRREELGVGAGSNSVS
jgi:hypothetical protein